MGGVFTIVQKKEGHDYHPLDVFFLQVEPFFIPLPHQTKNNLNLIILKDD